MAKFTHMSINERIKIEHMYNKQNLSARQIAAQLGRHPATIYREIGRGLCNVYGKDYRDVVEYSHQIAHKKYLENGQSKGVQLKIGKDHELVDYIEKQIADGKCSPAATLYRYIDDHLFLRITNKDLPTGKLPPSKNMTRCGVSATSSPWS